MHTQTSQYASNGEQVFIDQVIASRKGRPGALLSILEAVQDHTPHKYLPIDSLKYIAEQTRTPLSRIYSVATFYALFNLEPQAKTRSASAGELRVTRGVRAICWKACAWSSV
jgi:NADH-quinone oxidoreductase subunit E